MTVFVCIVNSAFYDDTLSHVECVHDRFDKAYQWKLKYEADVRRNSGIVVKPPSNGEDKELDRFLSDKHKSEFALKFISTEIKEFNVL